MDKIWFGSWESVLRTLILGLSSYLAMIILLRVSGKRTLSKLNQFDFVVTVALGSTLSASILNKNITLADGVTAFGVLIFLQFFLTWLSVRWKWFSNLVRSEPVLLFYKGSFLDNEMKKQRITKDELISKMRSADISSIENIDAVVLESDCSFSIIKKIESGTVLLEDVCDRERIKA